MAGSCEWREMGVRDKGFLRVFLFAFKAAARCGIEDVVPLSVSFWSHHWN